MKITETLTVAGPPDAAWALFENVPELARCLPGAQLTEDKGDGTYIGSVTVQLGPMAATFVGEAVITSDIASRSGAVRGKGRDKSGGSIGEITVQYAISPSNEGGTSVRVDADIELSGAMAQFGRTSVIEEMSARIVAEFVECVDAKLAAHSESEAAAVEAQAIKGVSLFISSLMLTIRRFFARLLHR